MKTLLASCNHQLRRKLVTKPSDFFCFEAQFQTSNWVLVGVDKLEW